jgi:hypothetical protein
MAHLPVCIWTGSTLSSTYVTKFYLDYQRRSMVRCFSLRRVYNATSPSTRSAYTDSLPQRNRVSYDEVTSVPTSTSTSAVPSDVRLDVNDWWRGGMRHVGQSGLGSVRSTLQFQ